MYKLAINRPITTLMFFMGLIVFGFISVFTMPVNLFPSVSIPLVKVTAAVNGDLSFVESKITKEIENALSEIDGIKSINSSSFDNFSVTFIEFELSKNLEVAANDVRDKIGALSLPVKPKIEKVPSDSGASISLFLQSKNGDSLELMRGIDEKLKPFFAKGKWSGKCRASGLFKATNSHRA